MIFYILNEIMALKIIGTVGQLSLSYEELISLKTEVTELGNRLYELYIYFFGSHKIFYCKFITEESHVSTKSDEVVHNKTIKQLVGKKEISSKVCLWKVLHLPFDLSEIVQSGKCLWAISSDSYADVKPYFQNVLKFNEVSSGEDNLMVIDCNDEFVKDNFECFIKIPDVEKFAIHKESFTLKYNLIDNSVIFCYKNLEVKSWDLELLVPVYHTDSLKLLKFKSVPILKIPLHFNEELFSAAAAQDATEIPKPVITLINVDNSSSEESQLSTKKFLYHLFSIDCSSSSNSVFLFGYQSGKVLWSVCSWSSHEQKFKTITELQILCDMKQPVIAIHFFEKLGEIKGSCSLLLVGALGKIVIITTENVFSNSHAYEGQALQYWTVTLYLHSPVQHHIILNDCILHSSEKGHLWVTVFSEERKTSKGVTENNLKIISKAADLYGIIQVTIINKHAGLILVVTAAGNLYLAQYIKSVNTYNASVALPSLMNEGLHQSAVMQHLLTIKYQQGKFFSALCTFAALKFKSIPRVKLSCSITKIDVQPQKFFLEINLKGFGKLNLDSDLWFVTISLCSYFQDNHTVISKTAQLIPGCDLTHYVYQLLLQKSNIKDFNEDAHLTCKGSPLSFSIAQQGDIIQIAVTTKCVDVLLGSRIAIMETLLTHQNLSGIPASKFISISASLHRKCEELSKIITSIYGNDVEPAQFTMKILKLYQTLRKELSEKLQLL
ncbi:uncharacterized protein LOC118185836 isoform X2 [Stegodyphus dumicola]|uniref:uncharacterized protein LOC118185836 isoform X2 n=1 Tax=Stegodyphus dumicola TaxID=202533 RepID=UPI0015A9A5DA|nr:uncharacterized protein LOC118185836 isoform X2 [Stegodyphus dumicola]